MKFNLKEGDLFDSYDLFEMKNFGKVSDLSPKIWSEMPVEENKHNEVTSQKVNCSFWWIGKWTDTLFFAILLGTSMKVQRPGGFQTLFFRLRTPATNSWWRGRGTNSPICWTSHLHAAKCVFLVSFSVGGPIYSLMALLCFALCLPRWIALKILLKPIPWVLLWFAAGLEKKGWEDNAPDWFCATNLDFVSADPFSVLCLKPWDFFRDQCFCGCSVFSRAESTTQIAGNVTKEDVSFYKSVASGWLSSHQIFKSGPQCSVGSAFLGCDREAVWPDGISRDLTRENHTSSTCVASPSKIPGPISWNMGIVQRRTHFNKTITKETKEKRADRIRFLGECPDK